MINSNLPPFNIQAQHAIEYMLGSIGFAPDSVKDTGKFEKFSTKDGDRKDTAGRYVARFNGRLMVKFYDHRQGGQEHTFVFSKKDEKYNPLKDKDVKEWQEQVRKKYLAEVEEGRNKAQDLTGFILQNADKEANIEHGYFKQKGLTQEQIADLGIVTGNYKSDQIIYVPMYREDGAVRNLQRIYESGDKRFLPDGEVKGCFHPVGNVKDDSLPLLIGEGLLTVASAYWATGYPAISCQNAGNIEAVTEIFRRRYPKRKICILADNDDHQGEINPKTKKEIPNEGVEKAQASAEKFNCHLAIATLPEKAKADFDDIRQARGLDCIKTAIMDALNGLTENMKKLPIKPLAEYQAEQVEWVWDPWLVRRGINLMAGAGGVGKTTAVLRLIALCVMGHPLPDGKMPPKNCKAIIYAEEDEIGVTILPRLEASGWNRSTGNIYILPINKFNPASDIAKLRQAIIALGGIDILFIDPIISILPNGKDTNKTNDVVSALRPYLALAQEFNICIIGNHHTNKGSIGVDAMDRIQGSTAWVNSSRSALLFREDEARGDYVMTRAKSNLASKKKNSGIRYSIEEVTVPATEWHSTLTGIIRVNFGEIMDGTANEILAEIENVKLDPSKAEDCALAIIQAIDASENGQILSDDLEDECINKRKISMITFRRVRSSLNKDKYIQCKRETVFKNTATQTGPSEEAKEDKLKNFKLDKELIKSTKPRVFWKRTEKPLPDDFPSNCVKI